MKKLRFIKRAIAGLTALLIVNMPLTEPTLSFVSGLKAAAAASGSAELDESAEPDDTAKTAPESDPNKNFIFKDYNCYTLTIPVGSIYNSVIKKIETNGKYTNTSINNPIGSAANYKFESCGNFDDTQYTYNNSSQTTSIRKLVNSINGKFTGNLDEPVDPKKPIEIYKYKITETDFYYAVLIAIDTTSTNKSALFVSVESDSFDNFKIRYLSKKSSLDMTTDLYCTMTDAATKYAEAAPDFNCDHNWSDKLESVAPTCKKKGRIGDIYYCNNCKTYAKDGENGKKILLATKDVELEPDPTKHDFVFKDKASDSSIGSQTISEECDNVDENNDQCQHRVNLSIEIAYSDDSAPKPDADGIPHVPINSDYYVKKNINFFKSHDTDVPDLEVDTPSIAFIDEKGMAKYYPDMPNKVGKYKVEYKLKEKSNPGIIHTLECELIVDPVEFTPKIVAPTEWYYKAQIPDFKFENMPRNYNPKIASPQYYDGELTEPDNSKRITTNSPTDAKGTYTAFFKFPSDDNYTVTNDGWVPFTFEVIPKPLDGKDVKTEVILTPSSFYVGDGQGNHTPTVKVIVDGKELTQPDKDNNGGDYYLDFPQPVREEAGTYAINIHGKKNYSGTLTASFVVERRKPNYTIPRLTATYGDTLADIELPTLDTGSWSWIDSNPALTSVGNVGNTKFKALFKPNDTTNYSEAEVDIPVTVLKRSIEVVVDDAEITYGETPAYTYSVLSSALAPGDTQNSLNLVLSASSANTLNVGTYDIKCISSSNNYDIKLSKSKLTVLPKEIALISASAASKDYDGNVNIKVTDPQFDGVIEGDNVTASISATVENPNAGTGKDVSLFVTLTGNASRNYILSGLMPTLKVDINKAQQKAPNQPYSTNVDGTSIKLEPLTGAEYSIDGTTWQDSTEFKNLTPYTDYTFYQRLKGDDNHEISPSSIGTTIKTLCEHANGDSSVYSAPEFKWGQSASGTIGCTAVRSCGVCGNVSEIPCRVSSGTVTVMPTCTESGKKEYIARLFIDGKEYAPDVHEIEVAATGHNKVVDKAVPATCTESGTSEGAHCSICGEILQEVKIIEPTGHTVVEDKEIAPTCVKPGSTAGSHCSVCNEFIVPVKEIPALGHKFGEITYTWSADLSICNAVRVCSVCNEKETTACTVSSTVVKEPTCIDDGLRSLTAVVELNGIEYGDSKEEAIKATGHKAAIDPAVAPTCTETGLTAGTHCSVCNEVLTKQDTVEAKGHVSVTDKAVEPTCLKDGLTEGSHCSVCKEVIEAQEVIPATGHKWNDPVFTWASNKSSCNASRNCSVCSAKETFTCTIESVIASEPTCTETGLKVYTATAVIDELEVTDDKEEEIKALGHKPENDAAVAPTCTETGLTAGTHCSVCGEVIKAQEEIPANGHKLVIDKGTPATCEKDGIIEGAHCSVCDTVISEQQVLPATGHDWNEPVYTWSSDAKTCKATRTCTACSKKETADCTVVSEIRLAPTCTEAGEEVYHAADPFEDEDEAGDTKVITLKATGHTPVTDKAVEATCAQEGLTKGSHCEVCGEVIVAQKTIAKKSHKIVSDPAVAPTCAEVGYTAGSHCEVCGEPVVEQEEIPALGHKYGKFEFKWAENYKTCSITRNCSVCKEDDVHECEVTEELLQEFTCEKDGYARYTAIITVEETEYKDVQEVVLKANGHNIIKYTAKDPAPGEEGWIEHWGCANCDACYEDPFGKKPIPREDVIIPALPGETTVTTDTSEILSDTDNSDTDSTDIPSDTTISTDTENTDIPTDTDDTTDIPTGTDDTTDIPTGTDDTTDIPTGTDDTTDIPTGTDDTTDVPSDTDDTTEVPSDTGDTTEVPTGTDDTTEVPSDTGDTTEVPSDTGDTTEVPTGTDDTTEVPSDTDDTTEVPTGTDDTTEVPTDTDNTDIPSDTETGSDTENTDVSETTDTTEDTTDETTETTEPVPEEPFASTNGIEFALNHENKTAVIIEVAENVQKVIIPEKIKGCTVVDIDAKAFENSKPEKISFPATIEEISAELLDFIMDEDIEVVVMPDSKLQHYFDAHNIEYQLAKTYTLGDLNSNELVDTDDALLILQYITNIAELTDEQKVVADINGDLMITTEDALEVLQAIVGLIDALDKIYF